METKTSCGLLSPSDRDKTVVSTAKTQCSCIKNVLYLHEQLKSIRVLG